MPYEKKSQWRVNFNRVAIIRRAFSRFSCRRWEESPLVGDGIVFVEAPREVFWRVHGSYQETACECAALWSRWGSSKIKSLWTDIREFLKAVFERTTEGFDLLSKHFETKVALVLERVIGELKYEVVKTSDGLKAFFSESNSGGQRESANCVSMLSIEFNNVPETIVFKFFSSTSGTSAASSCTTPTTSVGPRSRRGGRGTVVVLFWKR